MDNNKQQINNNKQQINNNKQQINNNKQQINNNKQQINKVQIHSIIKNCNQYENIMTRKECLEKEYMKCLKCFLKKNGEISTNKCYKITEEYEKTTHVYSNK
jgi:capsule polysaccharide export protein KpsE/RkpR